MDYDYPCNFSRPVSEQLSANGPSSTFSSPSSSSSSSYSSLAHSGNLHPTSPAYVSAGIGYGGSSKLFSLISRPTAKSSINLESVVPLVPPKHRVSAGIYYDMPKNIPVDPRWQQAAPAKQIGKFPVPSPATASTPNLYDRPKVPEKSSLVQTKQSMLLSNSTTNTAYSTLPVIVGASLKKNHSTSTVSVGENGSASPNNAYMSSVLGQLRQTSSTSRALPPLPTGPLPERVTGLRTAPPPPPTSKPFPSTTANYDVLPVKKTAVKKTADQVDSSVSKPIAPPSSYKLTSLYSKKYVNNNDDDEDDEDDCDYDYDYVCLESKKKLDDEDAAIRRVIPRDLQSKYEKLALSSSGGVDLSHLERSMREQSLANSRVNSKVSVVKNQLLASYRHYLSIAQLNFECWINLTLQIIERNHQPSVYINFAKHILLSGQNLLLVAKSLNRHYSQVRSLSTFADSFYEYLRVIVLKTKRATVATSDRAEAIREMVESIQGALRFASHLKVDLIQ